MMINTKMHINTSRRLRKNFRRVVLVCVAYFLLVLFYPQASFFGPSLKATDVLNRVLSHQSHLQVSNTTFPKKIWQTWNVSPLFFEERELNRSRTWVSENPGFLYEVLTDDNGLQYVETHYGPDGLNRPDIVEIYRELSLIIIKADLLRYLVMYADGGVYTDIDVEALKPVNKFVPAGFDERDVDLVIGVEIDEPSFAKHPTLGAKCRTFCQWTFMSKPRVPVLLKLIDNIIDWLDNTAKTQDVPISNITLSFDEVILGTGPSAFTGVILDEMSSQTGQDVTWDDFHLLSEPKRVGNILVLTVDAFAAGQDHSNSGFHNSTAAMVKHHYHASTWDRKHSRYSHPAYGMLEECGWNSTCVKLWDDHVAGWEKLSDDERRDAIGAKARADNKRYGWHLPEFEEEEKEAAEKEATGKEDADKSSSQAEGSNTPSAQEKAAQR
jgi:mannosyltransferase OCH1-like enzyme